MIGDVENALYICEHFPTIQGEGTYTGVPSYLIRLSFCNLTCPFCDTKYSWTGESNLIIKDSDQLKEFLNTISTICNKMHNINSIMLTGGEPLLYLDNNLFRIMIENFCNEYETVEIETNGITLNHIIEMNLLDLSRSKCYNHLKLNISPKLDMNCYTGGKEERDETLKHIIQSIKTLNEHYTTEVKLIYDPKNPNIKYIKQFAEVSKKLVIMPLTPNRNKYKIHQDFLKDYINNYCIPTLGFCVNNGYTFSPRIHTFLFETKEENF